MSEVICRGPSHVFYSIRARRRRCFRHHRCVGSGARADNGACTDNLVQDRRRLQIDNQAVESRQGRMGKAKAKMVRLPEAVEGSKARRPQELVVPCIMHDGLRVNPARGAAF
jgi:hypothetical protein